jgi:hypothetical protein
MGEDDPAVPDDVGRLSNSLFRTLAEAGASHGDGFQALVQVQLTQSLMLIADDLFQKIRSGPR